MREAGKLLKDAVAAAKASGKTKASAKHIKRDWKAECKKHGTDLYEAVMWAKEDPNFSKLTAETQETINKIIDMLPAEPPKKEVAPKKEKAPKAPAKKAPLAKAIAKATAKKGAK